MAKPRKTLASKAGARKPWEGRFRERTARSVEAFSESVSFDARLWAHDIRGSIAHARMLGSQGIIPKADAARIIAGLEGIAREIEAGKFTFRPELEDVHMNIEHALMERIGPAGGRLHTARSRNDQVALDMRLYLRDEADACMALVRGLQAALVAQAARHGDAIMPGYTHMQRAQPVLLAHHLLAYVEMLERDRGRLADARARMDVLPLGSGALAGTSLPIDRKAVARELGFKTVGTNSMDGVSDRDFAVEFTAAAALIMTHLSRMSEDLVLWATEEFSYIALPDAYATGSSIMPQKKNPDVPELVRGKAGRVHGALVGLLTLMKGLPMAYNRDMQEDKPLVFDAVDTVKACLGVLADMMPHVTFNTARMAEAAAGGFSTATDVAEYLVGRGMPFREAHGVTGRLVALCIDRGCELWDLTLAEFRKASILFNADILKRLSAPASVRSRSAEGGTAPASVKRQIARWKKRLG
jgi:argininosuccinate lyase